MTIKAIIIDDEQEGRDLMENLLKLIPEIQLVGIASDADSGIEAIEYTPHDLVFLDINMPGKTGLDLVKELSDRQLNTTIVFVTAYDEFAVQAIKLAAFDFVLKPIDPDELRQTVSRFLAGKIRQNLDQKIDHLISHLDAVHRLRLNTREGYILVDPAEVISIQASGNYAEIRYINSNIELVTLQIGSLLDLFKDYGFLRASRSCLINLTYLRKFDRKRKQCFLETTGETFRIQVSRNHSMEFEKLFK